MRRNVLLCGVSLLFACRPASAQQYHGSFSATNDEGGQTVVRLVQSGEHVSGTMSGLGSTFRIEGELDEGTVVGTMTMGQDDGLWFEAELDENDLHFTLLPVLPDGEPDFDLATTLLFTRIVANPMDGAGKTSGRDVVIGREPEPQPQQQQPQQAPRGIHDGTKRGMEWAEFFANMKATQMESYSSGSAGGYSSRTDYHLCANGRFFMTDENSVSVDTGGAYGYGGGSGSGTGSWRVFTQGQDVGLELRFQNGDVSQHRLGYDDENRATYIDGSRWYITPTDQCGY